MDIEKVIKLVEVISASPLKSFVYEEGNLKISLEKDEQGKAIVQSLNNIQPVPESIEEPAVQKQPEGTKITSPLVGIYYTAKSPKDNPFVKIGDHVKVGQIIGIVEAMKLMNEVESTVEGTVTDICVSNGESVEYGQPLIIVKE